jgi:hypothetical protein
MPGYLPTLELQIMILEVLSEAWLVILVIDILATQCHALRDACGGLLVGSGAPVYVLLSTPAGP